MDNQQFFDKTVAFLRTQGEAAVTANGACRYRTSPSEDRVLMCAVGCHIPDNVYSSGFEGVSASELLRVSNDVCALFGGVDRALIEAMQLAHDDGLAVHGLHAFEDQVENIAFDYGLKYITPEA